MIDKYESESDLDPNDIRIFEEGLIHSVVHVRGSARFLCIHSNVNLLAWGITWCHNLNCYVQKLRMSPCGVFLILN